MLSNFQIPVAGRQHDIRGELYCITKQHIILYNIVIYHYNMPYYNIPYYNIPYSNIPCNTTVYYKMVCYNMVCVSKSWRPFLGVCMRKIMVYWDLFWCPLFMETSRLTFPKTTSNWIFSEQSLSLLGRLSRKSLQLDSGWSCGRLTHRGRQKTT